ncbi:MAG: hypothetical protein Q8880_12220 [Bacteroidota bacterium]|nr:hypothetical protein [Bacteroidota bacterium]
MKFLKVLIIACIILVINNVYSQSLDFRNHFWGSSKELIKRSENCKLLDEKTFHLIYSDSVGSLSCKVYFYFTQDNMLRKGVYVFSNKYNDPLLYVKDYNFFKNYLIEKYGKPNSDERIWNVEKYRNAENKLGDAISNNDLSLLTTWNKLLTTVKLSLSYNTQEKNVELKIEYTSNALQEIYELKENNKILEKL